MQHNAFTVGLKASYDWSLEHEPVVRKMGREPDYDGGWVWRTREEVESFLGPGHKYDFGRGPVVCGIYGLILENGWELDVSAEPHPEDGVHRLINTSQIVRLED